MSEEDEKIAYYKLTKRLTHAFHEFEETTGKKIDCVEVFQVNSDGTMQPDGSLASGRYIHCVIHLDNEEEKDAEGDE